MSFEIVFFLEAFVLLVDGGENGRGYVDFLSVARWHYLVRMELGDVLAIGSPDGAWLHKFVHADPWQAVAFPEDVRQCA